jgi:hypothetical protein
MLEAGHEDIGLIPEHYEVSLEWMQATADAFVHTECYENKGTMDKGITASDSEASSTSHVEFMTQAGAVFDVILEC